MNVDQGSATVLFPCANNSSSVGPKGQETSPVTIFEN